MELGLTEEKIIDWYERNWNGKTLLSRKPWPVSLDTSLSTGDHAWLVETGEEIMNDYFRQFDISHPNFNLLEYWPVEPGLIPNILLPKSMRNEYKAPKQLTLRMLAESAKVGHWLFD